MNREKEKMSEQGLDNAMGEVFYGFLHTKSIDQCVKAIRDAFKATGYTKQVSLAQAAPEELREKVADIIVKSLRIYQDENVIRISYDTVALDQILALTEVSKQQAVEEAERRGIESGVAAYESTCTSLLEQAKREERERIKGE